jgi:MFS family permease
MMPVLQKELHLDYQDIGHITGAFAIVMGAAALLAGNLADKIGFRAVVVPAMIVFSTLAGFAGLAVGLASMVAVRALMGPCRGCLHPREYRRDDRRFQTKPTRLQHRPPADNAGSVGPGTYAEIAVTRLLKDRGLALDFPARRHPRSDRRMAKRKGASQTTRSSAPRPQRHP